MRILVLGGDGMLGHQLLKSLQGKHDVRVTLRQPLAVYLRHNIFTPQNSYAEVNVQRPDDLSPIISDFQPQAVINAVGIVKQSHLAKEIIPSLEVNALFPHRLALMCKTVNARMIHMSTDCIFSGRKGNYAEIDVSDAEDIYGRTKYLGEVHEQHCVTIRSSIIGLELSRKTSLIEWFLAQTGTIKGFKRAFYSGLTTLEMSRLIEAILTRYTDISGVWQVSSATVINKYDLLTLFAKLLGRTDITIQADEEFFCDRSLQGQRFCQATGYQPPSWEYMLKELAVQVNTSREKSYVI